MTVGLILREVDKGNLTERGRRGDVQIKIDKIK